MLKLSQVIFFSIKILPNRVKNQKCQYYINMLLSSILHVKKLFLQKFSELYLHVRCLQRALPLELELQDTAGNNDKVIRIFFSIVTMVWTKDFMILYCKRVLKKINHVCYFSFLMSFL